MINLNFFLKYLNIIYLFIKIYIFILNKKMIYLNFFFKVHFYYIGIYLKNIINFFI